MLEYAKKTVYVHHDTEQQLHIIGKKLIIKI